MPAIQIFRQVIDFILPARCAVTGDVVDTQGALSPSAWGQLNFITAPMCQSCGLPFDYAAAETPANSMVCVSCSAHPPPYSAARSVLVYDDASRDLILRFKHADQLHLVVNFVHWMKQAAGDMLAQADYLVPVPLHTRRLMERRYNQAAVISNRLSAVTGIPSRPDLLIRRKATHSQGLLGYKDRHQNVKNVFAVPQAALDMVEGASIVLIDDVLTSGATVKECSKTLLKAGAADVKVLTVAKTLKPGVHGAA